MKDNELNIVCVVQARMSSSRLPSKMMMSLSGRPVIEQVFRQLSFSKKINICVLATSVDSSDNELYQWAVRNEIPCYRGSLDDVLDRYYGAVKNFDADIIVRITGDCPLIDPEIIDKVIELHLRSGNDYTSNANPPTFPDGYDTEVFSFASLEKAWKDAKLVSEREHVTPYLKKHSEIFKLGNYASEKDFSGFRTTLDNKEDYKLISAIYEKLYKENDFIRLENVVKFLSENPDLADLNSHIKRNEGYKKSLDKDKKK